MNIHTAHARHGFLVMDAAIGIAIIAVLTMSLASAVHLQRRSVRTLAAHRTATAIAEQAMAELHLGRSPKPPDEQTIIRALTLEQQPPAGMRWVQVEVEHRGGTAHLVGLVPARPPGGRP